MADLSDVENALVTAVTAAVYPSGTGGASSIGASCRVYRGWPNARALDADIAAGVVNVTVFAQAGLTRNTTRFPLDWQDISLPAPTITAVTSGQAVTFGGAAAPGNLCGIRAGGQAYAYAAAAADTPQAVAAALRAMIPGAAGSGPTVNVSAAADLLGRVVSVGTVAQETRRQVQGFLITAWCPTPALRDATAATIDAALASIPWLTLADGTGGRLIYRNSFTSDVPSKDALWRRDLTYSVEYPTTNLMVAAEMLFGVGTVTVNSSGITVNLEPE